MELSLAEIEATAHALLTVEGLEADLAAVRSRGIAGWSIDSRSISRGDLFFAIEGERFDGHDFVERAREAGAAAAVVRKSVPTILPLLQVDDSVRALGLIARRARRKWNRPMVAVTGSAGKTSAKEIIAAMLAVKFAVGKTAGNFNNHLGLPLTLLRMQAGAEVAVVEMGMNHAGEIRELAAIAEPQIGVVTNVGYAHIEAFSSIEGIAAAKRELIERLPADGVAVLNADDPLVAAFRDFHRGRVVTFGIESRADLQPENLEFDAEGSGFTLHGVRFRTALKGRHSILNILAGIAVAGVFSIEPPDLVEVVSRLEPGTMRGERRNSRGITILDDSYNSNPEAVRAMLDVLRREPARRRIAVLGEMLELGPWSEKLHRQVGRYAAESGVEVLVAIGSAARFVADEALAAGMPAGVISFFDNSEAAGSFLRDFVQPGDAILFKGSRGIHVEKALARMEK